MGLEDLVVQIENYCSMHEESGILILTDLFGGTPSNAACIVAAKKNASVVTGVNLPMILEVVLARSGKNLKELTNLAVQSGKEGIREIQLKTGEKK
jgi:mannose/fructose-specific phosphotransferase system component IIA